MTADDNRQGRGAFADWSRRDFLVRSGQGAALVAMGGGLSAFLEACGGGGSKLGSSGGTTQVSLPAVPSVANASAAKKYSGQTVVVSYNPVGIGGQIDRALAAEFTKETGIKISYVVHPQSTSDTYAEYQRVLTSHGTTPDILDVDVIYPGAFGPYLADLTSAFSDVASQYYPAIIQNNTVNGKLVAIPYTGDFGLLYYRTDLLQKYGYSAPPKTWQELTDMATKAQDGEHASNPSFYGFVFQGNAYEGLTCDSLEWLGSYGGGFFAGGKPAIDSAENVAALKLAQSWINKISPSGVTGFQEEDARTAFTSGNAMFMRNWPYAYALGGDQKTSKVVGKFDVAPLPAGSGSGAKSVAAVGGWQRAVNGASQHPEAAIEFMKYYCNADVQKYRAVNGTLVPTMPSVAQDSAVLKAMPFLSVQTNRETRPSLSLGTKYNEGSTFIFQGINQILKGSDVNQTVAQIKQQLATLSGS